MVARGTAAGADAGSSALGDGAVAASGAVDVAGTSLLPFLSARNAGVPLVLVSFGYTDTPAGELDPDILIDHFDELPAACARLLAA